MCGFSVSLLLAGLLHVEGIGEWIDVPFLLSFLLR